MNGPNQLKLHAPGRPEEPPWTWCNWSVPFWMGCQIELFIKARDPAMALYKLMLKHCMPMPGNVVPNFIDAPRWPGDLAAAINIPYQHSRAALAKLLKKFDVSIAAENNTASGTSYLFASDHERIPVRRTWLDPKHARRYGR